MSLSDIITPAFLRNFLSGIDFYKNDDVTLRICDSTFELHIDNAISVAETRLGISLRGTVGDTVEQQLDVMDWDPQRWHLHRLPRRPVQSIDSVSVQYSNYPKWELPKDWLKIRSAVQGDVQLLPGAGNIRYLQGPLVQYAQIQYNNITPAYLRINYTYGFESVVGTVAVLRGESVAIVTLTGATALPYVIQAGDWLLLGDHAYQARKATAPSTVALRSPVVADYSGELVLAKYEAAMVSAVASYAAIPLLDQLGTLLRPAGVTSQSVEVDSLSQGLTFNPRGPYASLIDQHLRQYNDAMVALENKWGRINMVVV